MIDLKELEELDRKRKMLRAIVLKDPRFGFDKGLTYMTKVFENTVSAQVYGIRYQNYLIEMLKAKTINQKENCGDCSLNDYNIEIKASILNDTNRKLNLLQLRTYQNVHFYLFLACDSVHDEEYIYILNKDELSREFKAMNAVQTHGTKDANKDNVNTSFSLKLNFSKENDHLKRWNELYRVLNINEVIKRINEGYKDGKEQ